MKKFWQVISAVIIGMLLLVIPAVSQAQDSYVSVRVEPGVAVPVGNPQDDRFGPGGYAAVKPEFSIYDLFSFGPSAAFAVFPSDIDGVDPPAIWAVGGFARLKRPHGFEWNPDEGVAAVSPWVDIDVQYVRTGPLDRAGYAVGAGASWPVEDTRMVWAGPFARYQGVHQADDLIGRNTNESHTLIFGVSFEIGEVMKPRAKETTEEKPLPVKPQPRPTPKDALAFKDVNIELKQVIQFAWDSDKLDRAATQQLDDVVKTITDAKEFKAIKIEGHASSEGQVAHNNTLAQRRADSVLKYLVLQGIPRDKLSAVGFGSKVPVATNTTNAGRILNRRAEFVVNFVIVQEVK